MTNPDEGRREFTDAEIGKIADALQGTCCSSPEQEAEAIDKDWDAATLVDCYALDELVFECARCGWWCETGELSDRHEDENVCQECEDD